MTLNEFKAVVRRSSAFDLRRTRYTVYVSWVLLPVLIIFPFLNSYTGLLAYSILAVLAIIAGGNALVYGFANWTWGLSRIPSLGALVALMAMLYFANLGYGEGASAMWMFILPLLSMFMLGIGLGTVNSLLGLVGSLYLMSSTSSYPYSYEFLLRFGISYGVVTALSLGFEYWRVSLELQIDKVDEKLARTQTALAEMASVCAWCNAIKREDNSWQSLEEYVSGKEHKQISHSICPDCAAKNRA